MPIHSLSNHSALFSSFFFDNPDPMWLYNRATLQFIVVNDAALAKYGYSKTEFLEMTILDIRPEEDLPALFAAIKDSERQFKRAGVWRHLTKNGDVLFVEITSHATSFDGNNAVMVCARDVTTKIQLEHENIALLQAEKLQREELERSWRLLEIAGRSGRFGGWRVDLNTMQAHWSEQTAAIHGFSGKQDIPAEQVIEFYTPAYQPLIKERFNRCARYGTGYDEIFQLIDQSGKTIWVRSIGEAEYNDQGEIIAVQGAFQDVNEIIITKGELAEVQQDLYDTLEQISDAFFLLDNDWQFVFVNRKAADLMHSSKDQLVGKNVWQCFPDAVGSIFQLQYERALKEHITVQFDEYFTPLNCTFSVTAYPTRNGLAVYFRDVTEQQNIATQLERSANLQQQAHQLDALAKLTGGIAHDFNNLLTVIISNAELLTEQLAQRPDDLKSAQLCQLAALKAANLTKHLLAFGRQQLLKPEKVTLNGLFDSAIPLVRHALIEKIKLSYQPSHLFIETNFDKEQFALALLNLVMNAQDAMPEGGTISIYSETAPQAILKQYQLPKDQDFIQVKIADTGIGISEQVRTKAFEPFFTTKATGEGFGLGLSFVYGLMQQSGGMAYIENIDSGGCCVSLVLPILNPGQTYCSESAITKILLLVEDDELMRCHLTLILQRDGYSVTGVCSADKAFIVLTNQHFDFLLCDEVIPGNKNGKDLASQFLQIQPHLKVLMISDHLYKELPPIVGCFPCITKPFSSAALLEKLCELSSNR